MCNTNVCAGGHASCQPSLCVKPAQFQLPLLMPEPTLARPVKVIPIVNQSAASAQSGQVAPEPETSKSQTAPEPFRYEIWVLHADASAFDYKQKREGYNERLIRSAALRLAQNPDYVDVAIEKWNTVTNTMVCSIPVH